MDGSEVRSSGTDERAHVILYGVIYFGDLRDYKYEEVEWEIFSWLLTLVVKRLIAICKRILIEVNSSCLLTCVNNRLDR